MPKLSNEKHELFAYYLAKGHAQGEAYINAGYTKNSGGASRLAQTPQVIRRVKELKKELYSRINEIVERPSEESARGLAEMGLTLEWCAQQFQDIAAEARDAGQFAAANTAISNIQKLIEIENGKKASGEDSESGGGSKVDIKEVTNMFKEMRGFMESSKKDEPEVIEQKRIDPADFIDAEILDEESECQES